MHNDDNIGAFAGRIAAQVLGLLFFADFRDAQRIKVSR
jgi:hypothetical protein